MKFSKVDGSNKGSIRMYALSTCVWCKRTKKFFDDLGVEYEFIDVDQLEKSEKDECMAEVRRWNERGSFPTIVVNGETCIVGFKEEDIKKAIGV